MSSSPLDLYSTSPTNGTPDGGLGLLSSPEFEVKQQENCIYHAPYFAYEAKPKTWIVTQGNCHHWDCPRCGLGRAKQEYWRVVNGCAEIVRQGKALWFITITTRGADLSLAEAEQGYLLWTSRLLDNLRIQTKRTSGHWAYVQVTERQDRGHPHSHILTTFNPDDAIEGCVQKWEVVNGKRTAYWQDALRSDVLQAAVCNAGLGEQYDLSHVENAAAASRYVAKYFFKASLLSVWPPRWKRVRYSQNWPKPQHDKTNAMVLLKREDWQSLMRMAVFIRPKSDSDLREIAIHARGSDVVILKPKGIDVQ